MHNLAPYPVLQFFDDNGSPLSGGKLYTYYAGTTNAKDTYVSANGSPNANPIVLDAAGRINNTQSACGLWLGTGAYKFKLTDANDTEIYTVDNIQGSEATVTASNMTTLRALVAGVAEVVYLKGYSSNGDGGEGWFYWNSSSTTADDDGVVVMPDSAGTGRWIRVTEGYADPRWWGAKGDGTTNDTAAFIKANTLAVALGYYISCTSGSYRFATDPVLTAYIRLEPNARLKWTGFKPTIKTMISSDDVSKHFEIVSADDDSPFLSKMPFVRPEWFGALADGSTDDYNALQAAINSVSNIGGGDVQLAASYYACGSTLTMRNNTRIIGLGQESVITFSSGGSSTGITVNDGDSEASIERLAITSSPTSTGWAIKPVSGTIHLIVAECVINGFTKGIQIIDSNNTTIINTVITGLGIDTADGVAIELGKQDKTDDSYVATLSDVEVYDFQTGLRNYNTTDLELKNCSFSRCTQSIETASDIVATSTRYNNCTDIGGHIKYLDGGKAATVDADGVANTLVDQLGGYDITEHSTDENKRGEFNFYKNAANSSTLTATVDNDSLGIINFKGVPTGAADWTLMASIEGKQDGASGTYNKGEIEFSVGSTSATPSVQAKISDAATSGDSALYLAHNDGATTALKRVKASSAGSAGNNHRLLSVADGDGGDQETFVPGPLPVWHKFTVGYSDLVVSAMTKDILLLSLPAKSIIHDVVIKHGTAFTGIGITGVTVSLGIAAYTDKFATAFNILQAPGDTVGQHSISGSILNFTDASVINAYFISTGANLIQLTTGSVDIWILASTLI